MFDRLLPSGAAPQSIGRACLVFLVLVIALAAGCSEPPAPEVNDQPSSDGEQFSANSDIIVTPSAIPASEPGGDSPAPPSFAAIAVPERTSTPVVPTSEPPPTLAPRVTVKDFSRVHMPPAPDRDLFRLAYELLLPPGHPEVGKVVDGEQPTYQIGRVDDFYLVDLDGLEKYQSSFELRHVSPHAYWYVEEGFQVELGDLQRAAIEFEEVIYPRVTNYFGTEWTPGVDNDPHLTIVHGDIRGAGGYFSSTDEYPSAIRPHSNQREMIYINISYLRVGSPYYYSVLAHELNHAVLWNHDSSEDTWISEGLAELSVTVAGYPQDSISRYLQRPYVPLVHWPLDDAAIGAHYGGASLFMHYLYEHYSGLDGESLREIMTEQSDNIAGIIKYLADAGYDKDFHAVLQDWVAANFLDEESGPYGYSGLEVQAQKNRTVNQPDQVENDLAQYGTHYVEMGSKLRESSITVKFDGIGYNSLLPVEVSEPGCWWSNVGDSITSSLTREVDLTGIEGATLKYDVWYSIEEEWDYVYLQVSEDGGSHWDILDTPLTSAANPIGVAFGPGYTGASKGWQTESVDLSKYSGRVILVRFQYVTDDALNDMGMCLQGLKISGNGNSSDDGGWSNDGFVFIDNRVPQEFAVQVIQKGDSNNVLRVPLHFTSTGMWQGELTVEPYDGLDRTVVAITAMAPATREKAEYRLSLENAEDR